MVHSVDTKILSDILVIPHWQAWENRMNSTSGTDLYKMSSFLPVRSCLLLPSLATIKGVSADSISTGGIGAGKWSGSCILMSERTRKEQADHLFPLRLPGFSPSCRALLFLLASDQQVHLSLWFPSHPFAVGGSPHVPDWAAIHLSIDLILSLWWLSGSLHRGGGFYLPG